MIFHHRELAHQLSPLCDIMQMLETLTSRFRLRFPVVPIFSRKSLKVMFDSIERFVSPCVPGLPPSDLTKEMETIHPEMGNDHSEDRRPGAEGGGDTQKIYKGESKTN